MQKTQTICLVILTVISVSASLYFLKSVLLPFVIALFIVVGVLGASGGQRLSARLNQRTLKRIFAAFLVVMAVFMLVREGPRLVRGETGATEPRAGAPDDGSSTSSD
jgi:uncharacterized membrane protein YfcA